MKNFFSKLWIYIKKAFNVTVRFVKDNIWASVLGVVRVIVLLIMALQGIIKAIDSCGNDDNIENRATVITSGQLEDKLENGDTFVLFIGSQDCAHCKQFYKTINTYIKSTGNEIFYFDTGDTTDLGRTKMTAELEDRLLSDIETDRGITSLATPTTVYIENGEFKDAIQGAYGMDGGANYLIFCEVIEGKYVGKATYTDKLESEA